MANIGKIISARGPVIDIAFDGEDKLPRLNTAIRIQNGLHHHNLQDHPSHLRPFPVEL